MPNEGTESDESEGGSASQSRPKATNSRRSSGNRRVSSGSSSPPKKGSQSKAEGKRRAREESIEPPADEFDWPDGANGDDDTGHFDQGEEQYDQDQEEEEEDQVVRASGSKRKSPPKKAAKSKKDSKAGPQEVVTKIVSKQSKKRSYEGDDANDSKFFNVPLQLPQILTLWRNLQTVDHRETESNLLHTGGTNVFFTNDEDPVCR